ncbi:MAG: DUF4430 domain-containing protein [Oscillospiraceae bacterium]|nr:DUF4430 domain-containing protein [Oscillospiraceae bacterium]
MEKKQVNKKVIGAIVALVVLIAVVVGCLLAFGPKTSEGSKTITVQVVHADKSTKDFTYKTDAQYLAEVLKENKLIEGEESEYGLFITTVDGEKADYNTNGSYWSIYVNGEYGQYGADQQPVNDGDTFKLAYEVYQADSSSNEAA